MPLNNTELMKFRSVICIALATVSSLLICACANDKVELSAKAKPTPTATPQYLWTTEYIEVDNTSYTLSPLFCSGDGFYACGMEKVGENIPQEVIDEARKHKKEVINDGRYNVYENRLCFVGMDGTVSKLDDYRELDVTSNPEGWKDYSGVTNIGALTVADGEIYSLEYVYSSGNTKPDNNADIIPGENYNEFKTTWFLRKLSATGRELSCAKLQIDADYSVLNNSLRYVNGSFVAISIYNGKNGILQFKDDGEIIANTMTDTTLSSLILLNDGSVVLTHENVNGLDLYIYDFETCSVNAMSHIPNAKRAFSGTGSSEYYFDNGIYFSSYSNGLNKTQFNWSGVNVNQQKIKSDIYMLSESDCVFMTNGGLIVKLHRIDYDLQAERKTLILATENPSVMLLDAVSKFNQNHYDVKIDIENYLDYSNGLYGEKALSEYVYNHLGGRMPDIMDMSALPYVTMAKDGKLEDLYPYIERDSQLSKDDFFGSVLSTVEVGGKLYCTASGFSIDTVLGLKSVVGDNIGWNYSNYFDSLVSMGAGTDGFDSFTSRDEMLREVLALDLDRFINWDDMTCNFTDGKFYNLLCYLNTFPRNIDYAQYSEEDRESSDMRIRGRRQMLQQLTMYGIDDVLRAGYEFDGDTTFVGYPTEFGTGNAVNIFTFEGSGNLAMSSECENKETAWEFLRTFFTEEYQKKSGCFSTNRKLFYNRLEEAMIWTPVLSKKGEQLYDDDGEPRFYEEGTMYLSDYTPVPYYPLTEEKADELVELINTTIKTKNYNEDIYRIVKKSMDKDNACEVIQNEVTSYLNIQKNTG